MNREELFHKVIQHQRLQGRVCQDSEGDCRYRNDGKACAAGCLILDEYYDSEFEGATLVRVQHPDSNAFAWYHIDWRDFATNATKPMMIAEALIKSGVNAKDLEFVHSLQLIHDEYAVASWETQWAKLAEVNGFSMPPSPDNHKPKFDKWLESAYPCCNSTATIVAYEAYLQGVQDGQEKQNEGSK